MPFHQQNEYVQFDMLEVASLLGIKIIKPTGGTWYLCYCPWCGEAKFYFNASKSGDYREMWHCKRSSCGHSGKYPTNLAAELWGISPKEAYKELLRVMNGGVKPEIAYDPKKTIHLVKDEPAAPVERRHEVYTSLLRMLKIKKTHLEDLKKRGFPEVVIARNGYRSFPTDSKLRWQICDRLSHQFDLTGVPGFYINRAGKWDMVGYPEGYLIPVRDQNGLIQGLQLRVHPYNPEVFDDKYLWFSSSGKNRGSKAHQWIHFAGQLAGAEMVLVTEGPIKGDVTSHFLEIPVLAVPGTKAWRYLPEIILQLGIKKVINGFDMDRFTNPDVKKDVSCLVEELQKARVEVLHATWDTEWREKTRKNGTTIMVPTVKGIDDACLSYIEKYLEVKVEDFLKGQKVVPLGKSPSPAQLPPQPIRQKPAPGPAKREPVVQQSTTVNRLPRHSERPAYNQQRKVSTNGNNNHASGRRYRIKIKRQPRPEPPKTLWQRILGWLKGLFNR